MQLFSVIYEFLVEFCEPLQTSLIDSLAAVVFRFHVLTSFLFLLRDTNVLLAKQQKQPEDVCYLFFNVSHSDASNAFSFRLHGLHLLVQNVYKKG